VPTDKGNAKSFLDLCHRALAAAQQEGDGQIAFVSDKGKLILHTGVDHSDDDHSGADSIDWDTDEEASA
jgi:hypothetical protein